MKRRTLALLLVWLALLTLACRAVGSAGVAVFSDTQPSKDAGMKRDLLALMLAYPDSVTGAERGSDGLVYVLAAGERIVYDDGREKCFEQQLADADIEDTMAIPYPAEMIRVVPEGNNDPGRVRCYALLYALYGKDRAAIEKNLRGVGGCGPFNQRNGAALALEAAFGDLSGMAGAQPAVGGYVYPISGTYNFRVIAGTNTLSPHAFGIAIDLRSMAGDYWRYASRDMAQQRLESYPEALVAAMESHGFIWGGKWAHFDYLHFEYRPELMIKARADAANTGGAWHAGFPSDAATRALIDSIDAALE
jgi:hypothetical protein